MKDPQQRTENRDQVQAATRILFLRLLVVYAALLLLMVLMPFGFSMDRELILRKASDVFSLQEAKSAFDMSFLTDLFQNVILFLPLGFFCRISGFRTRTAALLGFSGSLLIEALQCISPERCPSIYDLLGNTSGSFAGALLAGLWKGRIPRFTSLVLRLDATRKAFLFLSIAGAFSVLFFLFFPLTRVGSLPWDEGSSFYLGGLPGDTSFWEGTIHRIAFSEIEDQTDEVVIDLDFQSPLRKSMVNKLPAGSEWTGDGLKVSGEPVKLKMEFAKRLINDIGDGGPFRVTVSVSPARFGYAQEGAVIAMGSDSWDADFWLAQDGRNLNFFLKNSVSGENWRQPEFKLNGCVSKAEVQRWSFVYDGWKIKAILNGKAWPDRFFFRLWTSPAGFLLASPFVLEPLTLYAVLFMVFSFTAARAVQGIRFDMLTFICSAVLLPLVLVTLLSYLSGFPPDSYMLLSVPLGALLGGYLETGWTRAGAAL